MSMEFLAVCLDLLRLLSSRGFVVFLLDLLYILLELYLSVSFLNPQFHDFTILAVSEAGLVHALRSPPGPAREHRAEARPAQSPALAGNSAARLPRSRLARPTHEHPLPGPTTPPAQPAAGPEGPSCSPRNAKPRREGGGPGGGGGGRTWGRRGSAAPEKRILPGPRRPRPPDSHNPAPRADGRSRGARSSAWETEPRRSKKLQRKEIQGQGSHPLAILQLRSRGQTRAPETWHWIGAHNLFFKGNLELHLKIL